ncbi:MAG TPA: MlaD family protein [Nocardioidaceae bacterium]|nr:MlaD family protein [Nocardioidaceae bacterium]
MITRKTKLQILVFVLITVVGVAYVGARYAKLDRLLTDTSYHVVAHFPESGGIFTGAEVSYRGVAVGQVSAMRLTHKGVDVVLNIQNDTKPIPTDSKAVVADRSAVGEQYVDLQPQTGHGPYLSEGSQIPMDMTETPISTTRLLTDIDTTVNSVNKKSLQTVTHEFGKAFKGTGKSLGRIIDTSDAFIRAANANFDITTALLQDGNTVLKTQQAKASDIKSFSKDLALFSDTLAASDQDLRTVIENGSATANQLDSFLKKNGVDLGDLINNLVTTGEITAKHVNGTEMILVVYPYVVSGGYTVVSKDPKTGLYDAHFGLIMAQNPPVCHNGYQGTDKRSPFNRGNRPMNTDARCTEPQAQTSARGAQWAPRSRPGAAYRAPVVGTYDSRTGKVHYTDHNPSGDVTYTGGAAAAMGEQSWKWLLLQPLAGGRQ